jgi:hypothetical protein
METIKKHLLTALVFVSILLLSVSYVSAFGIVMPYWEGRPLILEPGDTKDVALRLQNVGDTDITVQVTLTQGSEIAKILDESTTYTVPKGTTDTAINLRVSIPTTDQMGGSHTIAVSIKEVGSKGGGMVQLTNSIDKSFKVEVNTKPAPPAPAPEPQVQKPSEPEAKDGFGSAGIMIIVLVLIVALVAFMVHHKMKGAKPVASKKQAKSSKKTKI